MQLIVLGTIIVLTAGQILDIHNVNYDQKIIKFDLGHAKLKRGHHDLIHIVNLNEYVTSLGKLKDIIASLKLHGQDEGVKDFLAVSTFKVNELANRLNSLLPFKRTKRGLVNGLGSAIKFITGNMDAVDARRLDMEIRKIHEENTMSRNNLEGQKLLNSKIIERFGNITKHINKEQEIISENFKVNSNKIDKNFKDISEMQYLNRVNYNIDLLYNHITNIGEAIMLAKLNIISKYILNTEELARIREIMEYDFLPNRQDVMEYDNSLGSMNDTEYEVHLNPDEHIYELLELQAYYNNTNIIFNFKIPIISRENYNLFHIIPLPINNTKEISIPSYILHNKHKLHKLSSICPKIEGTYYCNSLEEELMQDSKCLGPIFTGGTAVCNLMDLGKINKIFQTQNNYIIFINIPNLLIKSTCRKQTPIEIKGTGFIFFKKCNVEINNIIYYDQSSVFWDKISLISDNNITIKANNTTKVTTLMSLEQISIDNLNNITTLKDTAIIHASSIYAALSSLLILIIVISLISQRTKIIYTTTTPISAPAPTVSLWPSLYSKGGGVTAPHH